MDKNHEHDPHPDEAPRTPPSPDLQRRLFYVALTQMRDVPEPQRDRDQQDPVPDQSRLAEALEQVHRWATLQESYVLAYEAYLSLHLPVPEGKRQSDDQLERYVGFAETRSAFVLRQLEQLGLNDALATLIREQGMEPGDVVWDTGVVWDHLCERYHVVEGFGGVHGFRR